jgi:hypothetical protein
MGFNMRIRDYLLSYLLCASVIFAASAAITSCGKEVRYVRRGEPCNCDEYDCVQLDKIK